MEQELHRKLSDLFGQKLNQEGYDLVELVPLPVKGEPSQQMQSVQKTIEEFELTDSGASSFSYLLKIRPAAIPHRKKAAAQPLPAHSEIYRSNGHLNTPFLLENAKILITAGDTQLARNIYLAILNTGENTAQALLGLGNCAETEGKFPEAQKHFEQSNAYFPTWEILKKLTHILIRQGKHHEAAETFERSLKFKDLSQRERLEIHLTCARSWVEAKNLIQAEKHYQSAMKIEPSSDFIRTEMGEIYLKMDQGAEAKRCFEDAIVANPKNYKALAGLGHWALKLGDKRAAHDYFAKSLDQNIQNTDALYHLVRIAYDLKTFATAARVLEEHAEVAPVNIHLLYSLAGLQFHLTRFEDSRRTTMKILQIDPNHTGAKNIEQLIQKCIDSAKEDGWKKKLLRSNP